MYIKRLDIKIILLVCLITSSIMSFFIKEACNTKVQASSLFMGHGQTKVVMITVDHIDLEDIASDKHLSELFNRSYNALVSSRQIGKPSASNAKLSIGSSKRLIMRSTIVHAVDYSSQWEAPKPMDMIGESGNILFKNIKDLRHVNKKSEYLNYIGYLGSRLNELNKTTCILGNSDTEIYNRNNALIAMDKDGIIDFGDLESSILYDQDFPGGKRTDFTKLAELYKLYLSASDFLILDTGDLARLERYRSQLSEESYDELRKQAISRISKFIKELPLEDNANITYILISAYPSAKAVKMGYKLTPFISLTGDEGGLLFSKSTRREGIITNLDIADYVIEKISPAEKSNVKELAGEAPLKSMLRLKRRVLNISSMRLPVLTWYAILEILCGTIGLLYMLNMTIIKNKTIKGLIKTTLLANIAAPAVLLYMSMLDISAAPSYFAVFAAASFVIAYLISKIFITDIGRFAATALFVNGSLIFDLLRGSILIRSSVFGYDPIIGARFYGIGNEFAGVYIGSGLLLAGCILHIFKEYVSKRPKTVSGILLIYFAMQIYVIGKPSLGANFGGTIAAVCGFYFFFNSIRGKRVHIKQLVLLGFLLLLVLGAVITLDLMNSGSTTHIGNFFEDIKDNGLKVLYSTFARKLEMNIRLIKYTIWTKVLLCIILIITIMFFKPVRLLHYIFKKYNHLASAWLGISTASIAGLLVNDSGIVMAATAMIFTGYTILYMCLQELETD